MATLFVFQRKIEIVRSMMVFFIPFTGVILYLRIESITGKRIVRNVFFFQWVIICTQDALHAKVNYTFKFYVRIMITLGCN